MGARTLHSRRFIAELPPDCIQRRAYDLGVHEGGYLVNGATGPASEILAPPDEPNFDLISELEVLADCSLLVADQLLPRDLKDLASSWEAATPTRRREICVELYKRLETHASDDEREQDELHPEQSWLRDYLNQALRRIFVRDFWHADPCEPNCFGKGQVMTAFFRRARARVLGVTPLQTAGDFTMPMLLHLSRLISEHAAAKSIELPTKLTDAFVRRDAFTTGFETAPNRFHMGVAVEIEPGHWYYVDPHMGSHGDFAAEYRLAELVPWIRALTDVHPGISVLSSAGHVIDAQMTRAAFAAGDILDVCNLTLQQWSRFNRSAQVVPSLLVQIPGLLEVLVEERIGLIEEWFDTVQKALAGDGVIVATCGGKDGEKKGFSPHRESGGEISQDLFNRAQISAMILMTLTGGAFPEETDGTATVAAMNKILGILHAVAYRRAARSLGAVKGKPSLIHPILEIYEPHLRIGIELISHINAITLKSNEVIMALAAITNGQHHQLLAATEPLRLSTSNVSKLAARAADTLGRSPYLLPASREGLSMLRSAGILQGVPYRVEEEKKAEESSCEPLCRDGAKADPASQLDGGAFVG